MGDDDKDTGRNQMDQRKPDWNKDQGNKGTGTGTGQNDWQGQGTDDMQQGKGTDPAQPSGTKPLERDQRPINQSR
jgi:hypothetical protein